MNYKILVLLEKNCSGGAFEPGEIVTEDELLYEKVDVFVCLEKKLIVEVNENGEI